MDNQLQTILLEIERYGEEHDRVTPERQRRMRNITRESGEFLAVLVRAVHAKAVLEIGTSNGYSTLWLADAVRETGGLITTLDLSEFKVKLAKENFSRAGLSEWIHPIHGEGGYTLENTTDACYDLVFLDSDRNQYVAWWADVRRVLKPGGLLVVDNATSHAEEMQPFVAIIKEDPAFTSDLVPIGKGLFLAVKSPTSGFG